MCVDESSYSIIFMISRSHRNEGANIGAFFDLVILQRRKVNHMLLILRYIIDLCTLRINL